MKKITGLCFLLLIMLMAVTVRADNQEVFENPVYSPEFSAQQERMLANIEDTFPKPLYKETFVISGKPSVSKPGDGYHLAERNNRLCRKEITLSAYKPLASDREYGNHFFNITGSYTNFYVGMDIQMIERSDTKNDYWYLRFTNAEIVGESKSSGVEIAFPIAIRKYETGAHGRIYTDYYDLSEFANNYDNNKIEMTRLNGYTSVFINGEFIAGFEDGLTGRFYQTFGSAIGVGQGYITAEFDNFVLRTTRN